MRRILFAEDDEGSRDRMETAVGDWNEAEKANGKAFEIESVTSEAEVKSALSNRRFDCALFDLRLPRGAAGKPAASVGNSLALATMRKRGVPVALVTANQAEISDELRGIELVRQFDKGDADVYKTVVEWLGEQWVMMDILADAKAEIEASAADVFLKRLWPQWGQYAALNKVDSALLSKMVARQYVSHMAELLGADGEGSILWHPFEAYVKPAVYDKRAHTGDVFRFDDGLWIVLSPQCDMATAKIPSVLLCKIGEGIADWDVHLAAIGGDASKTKKETAAKFFAGLTNQNRSVSQHFLPPLPGEKKPLLVEFGQLQSMPIGDLNGALDKRLVSLAAAFLSNLVQRFGAYISRAGQPNLDVAHFEA
jgi:CheY-like chemotaxis protein